MKTSENVDTALPKNVSSSSGSSSGIFLTHPVCRNSHPKKKNYFLMDGSYSTLDGSKYSVSVARRSKRHFLKKIKVPGSINGHVSTFSEIVYI